MQNFANSILYGTPLISPGAEAINELELSNAAYLSSWLGREISIPVDSTVFETILKEKILNEKKQDNIAPSVELNSVYIDRWNTNW